MSKINRIDDGERVDIESRSIADIQAEADFIDLEEELHNTKVTSEDMRWEQTGRHHFRKMIDEMLR